MKGFLSALIIILCLIVLLCIYTFYIEGTFSYLSSEIYKIETAIESEDFILAGEISRTFKKELKEKSTLLYYVTDRALIDDAFTECEKLLSFIKTEDKSEALASASGIRTMLEKTKEKSIIRILKINREALPHGLLIISR